MKTSKALYLLIGALGAGTAFAQESSAKIGRNKKTPVETQEKPAEADGIVVDDSNFKAIFNQSVAEETSVIEKRTRAFDVEIGASYNSISDLTLSNNYFTVDYAEDFETVPSVKFSMARDIWSNARTAVSGVVNFGYGMKQAKVTATSSRGTRLSDQVSLQWLPLSIGAQINQKIPGTQRFSAFLSPSVGSHYFHQSGTLDGIDQGYWVGFWNIRAGFVLFEPAGKKVGAAFEGVVLGANLTKGLGSSQKFSSWSADLGVKFAL